MIRIGLAVVLVALVGVASNAYADVIQIHNTGTASSGHGLAPTGQQDPFWQLVSTPSSSSGSTAYVVSTYKTTAWTSNPHSQWIAPQADETRNNPNQDAPGLYTYQTKFDLSGFVASTAQLTGSFAVDNCLIKILLNGVDMGHGQSCSSANYNKFTAFTLTSGFIAGLNTLTFVIDNTGSSINPSGLNVLISGTAQRVVVAEPATFGLLVLALFGLGGLWLRRRPTAS